MQDFVSKAAFGFLMAQLVPGAIAAFGFGLVVAALDDRTNHSLRHLASVAIERSAASSGIGIAHLIFALAIGMLIHGLHWSVLGFLEQKDKSVFRSPWHQKRLWRQVLLGPIQLATEILALFFYAKNIEAATMEEGVVRVQESKMQQFNFIQDFYLYFAQFFSHTSYALALLLLCGIVFVAFDGTSFLRIAGLLGIYLASGLFFVIGRIQLRSLFLAEQRLQTRKGPDGPNTTTAAE